MTQMIFLGITLGSLIEMFIYDRNDILVLFMASISLVFTLHSLVFAPIYALMALCELALGYKLSAWMRIIRQQYGW